MRQTEESHSQDHVCQVGSNGHRAEGRALAITKLLRIEGCAAVSVLYQTEISSLYSLMCLLF
jgi:hypothetical protein